MKKRHVLKTNAALIGYIEKEKIREEINRKRFGKQKPIITFAASLKTQF
jgi:hypothetical protein